MVHNTSLFDFPEKTVCTCPWRWHPVPIWADLTNKDAIVEALMRFLVNPGLINMIKIVLPALRSSTDVSK